MDTTYVLLGILTMALTTYLIRVLPMLIFRKKIKNRFIQSFLYYIPYTVLASMTFPAILTSTGSFTSGLIGSIVCLFCAYYQKSLLSVAFFGALSVFVVQLLGF